jgi:hypothetical protein
MEENPHQPPESGLCHARPRASFGSRIVFIIPACIAGTIVFVVLHWGAERVALPYHVSEWLAAVFGRPARLYGFQNLVAPRLFVLMITAMPTALMGWLSYRAFSHGKRQFSLRATLLGIAWVAVLFGLVSGFTSAPIQPLRAALFIVYCLMLSAACGFQAFRKKSSA